MVLGGSRRFFLQDSRGFKKVQEGSRRFKTVREGSRRFKKVQEGSRRFEKVQEGLRRFRKVKKRLKKAHRGSTGFRYVQEVSKVQSSVQSCDMYFHKRIWLCLGLNENWRERFFTNWKVCSSFGASESDEGLVLFLCLLENKKPVQSVFILHKTFFHLRSSSHFNK